MKLATSSSLKSSSSLKRGTLGEGDDSDAQSLFETPADLLCPITHELFQDPVINAAGQVYERSALVKALAHRLVDPISNLPLDSAALTTVWPMKSKAAAYRERAVRGCIAQVCRPSCRSPIRYLRRAAELSASVAAGADPCAPLLGVPGLTPALVDYVMSHESSVYDSQVLIRFAASLAACGERELAAGVYTKLLQQMEAPSAQQVEALQGLLRCWGGTEEDEGKLVERLAGLACEEGPEGCRPARFVGVLLEAGLDEELVLRFCEHIMSGAMRPAAPPAATAAAAAAGSSCGKAGRANGLEQRPMVHRSSSGSASSLTEGTASSAYADLLYAYTRLRCGRLDRSVSAAAVQLQSCAAAVAKQAAERVEAQAAGAEGEAADPEDEGRCGQQNGRKSCGRNVRQRRRIQRIVCSAVYALVSVSGWRRPLARVVQAATALVLLNCQAQDLAR